jgi:uncharacterized protein YecA (UPF0149 family)
MEEKMNTDDGRLYYVENDEALAEMKKRFGEKLMMLEADQVTDQQRNRKPPRVGKNDLCPCGSGKKFKNCHLGGKVDAHIK